MPENTIDNYFVYLAILLNRRLLFRIEKTLKNLLEGKEIHPVWFAVDTGFERKNIDFIDEAIGFPYAGFQLQKNEKIISKEKTGNWFHGTETIESENMGFALYGDGPKRNEEFIDALDLMNSNTLISQNVLSKNRLKAKTKYVKKNGVRIYGVVVTGPTKELLKLQNEKWVGKASVGEVDFWNWNESN